MPKLDLADLAPFLRLTLRFNRRQVSETDGAFAFKTPDAWLRGAGIRPRYDDVHFERKRPSRKKGTVLGVGSRLLDGALDQACQLPETYASTGDTSPNDVLFVFRCYDRITGNVAQPKTVICGIISRPGSTHVLKDWQILQFANELAGTVRSAVDSESEAYSLHQGTPELLMSAEKLLRESLAEFDLPFRQPEIELIAVIAGVFSRSANSVPLFDRSTTNGH